LLKSDPSQRCWIRNRDTKVRTTGFLAQKQSLFPQKKGKDGAVEKKEGTTKKRRPLNPSEG